MNYVRYIEHLQCQKRLNLVLGGTRNTKIVSLAKKMVPILVSHSLVLPMLLCCCDRPDKTRQRLTAENIAHSVGISSGSAHKILTQQLKLRKACAQYAPSLD